MRDVSICLFDESFRNTSSRGGISVILVCFSHSAEFESHLPNTVKTSVMDFNFVVAHDKDLLKSQIYFYMHPTCIEAILYFCLEEILCVTLAMQ